MTPLVSVLGTLSISNDDSGIIRLEGKYSRLLILRLILSFGEAVEPETLMEAIWGERTAAESLRTLVSRTRKACKGILEIHTEVGGYCIRKEERTLDAEQFLLGASLVRSGGPERAAQGEAALKLWRSGDPLPEASDRDWAGPYAQSLRIARASLLGDLAEIGLTKGDFMSAETNASILLADNPFDERAAALRAYAVGGLGRLSEALIKLADFRKHLATETGLDRKSVV